MLLRRIASFIFVGLVSFGIIEGIDRYFIKKEKNRLQSYFERIAVDTADRLDQYIKSHYTIALTLVDSLDTNTWNYGTHVKEVVNLHDEYIGVNLINDKGLIIKVYPENLNRSSLGKISQNYPKFKEGTKNSIYWLSPIVDLFQGTKGIVLYLPLQKKNGTTKGWLALVIDTQKLFMKIKSAEFLRNSELLIRDSETQSLAYSSGIEPDFQNTIFGSKEVDFLNRKMILKVWPKQALTNFQIIPYWAKFFIWLILTFLGLYGMKLAAQKKNAQSKLLDINLMLKLTTKDVINRFLDRDFTEEDKDQFISNLLEQIDLLKTLSQDEDTLEEKNIVILDLINQQTELFREVIQKKKIKFFIDRDSFKGIEFKGNEWLIQNCLITNIMLHLLKNSQEEAEIKITHEKKSNQHYFRFENRYPIENSKNDPFAINRRLEVATKIAQLYKGQFLLSKESENQLKITLILPNSV